jgi:hypothetical protein
MSFLSTFLNSVLDILFGCGHENVTRPFTLQKHTYKVCLDCGKELPYSAVTMSYLTAREVRAMAHRPARTASILAFDAMRAQRTPPAEHTLRDSNAAA